jgi:hypothetical protein
MSWCWGPIWHQELDYREPRKAALQYVFRHCQCRVLARQPPNAETTGVERRVAPRNRADIDRIGGRFGPIVPQPASQLAQTLPLQLSCAEKTSPGVIRR